MILHLAVFTWHDSVSEKQVSDLTDALQAMAAGIPELRSYTCGAALGLRPGGDYAVAAVVDDAAGLAAYLDSDAHRRVYDEHLGRMIESRIAAQLPVGDSAAL